MDFPARYINKRILRGAEAPLSFSSPFPSQGKGDKGLPAVHLPAVQDFGRRETLAGGGMGLINNLSYPFVVYSVILYAQGNTTIAS